MSGFRDSVTGKREPELLSNAGRIEVNVGAVDAVSSGQDVENNRLITYELWDYGENITEAGAVKAAPGILGVAQVVAADADAVVTFYDFAPSTEVPTPVGTEPKLGVIKLDVLGVQIRFGRPAENGIWASWASAGGEIAVGVL